MNIKKVLTAEENEKLFMLGNEATVRGALEAGIGVAATVGVGVLVGVGVGVDVGLAQTPPLVQDRLLQHRIPHDAPTEDTHPGTFVGVGVGGATVGVAVGIGVGQTAAGPQERGLDILPSQ